MPQFETVNDVTVEEECGCFLSATHIMFGGDQLTKVRATSALL